MKRYLIDHLKNLYGWKTHRKLVVISVDDYGNVRLDSKKARRNMDRAGLKTYSRFDAYDTLETREDLEMLYEVLASVKDKNNRSAVFTPFALPCNIDFEKMAEEGYREYHYEQLPQTYQKLEVLQPEAYKGAWHMWREGIEKALMSPQFHGREHLNLKVLEEKLAQKDKEALTALQNRSYTSLSGSGYPSISYTAAFDFWDFNENTHFDVIIKDGLQAFENVFGYPSIHFNPPGGREHPAIHKTLLDQGVRYIDSPWIKKEHQGFGKFKRVINYTGKSNPLGQIYQVRNVVFEPTASKIDWVNFAFSQIETAFRLNRPAIISSHRVNFCGHIEPSVRAEGLKSLKTLLQKTVARWPDVEFASGSELGKLMNGDAS